jgi:hypothetical protein
VFLRDALVRCYRNRIGIDAGAPRMRVVTRTCAAYADVIAARWLPKMNTTGPLREQGMAATLTRDRQPTPRDPPITPNSPDQIPPTPIMNSELTRIRDPRHAPPLPTTRSPDRPLPRDRMARRSPLEATHRDHLDTFRTLNNA